MGEVGEAGRNSGSSRRTFLRAVVGGAAAASGLGGAGAAGKVVADVLSGIGKPKPLDSFSPGSPAPVTQEAPIAIIPRNEIFGYLQGKDLETFHMLCNRESGEYQNLLYTPFIIRTRQYDEQVERVLNTLEFKSQFNLYENKVNLKDLFMGLIFAESKGDKGAKSPAGATGLSQVMKKTAIKLFEELKASGDAKKLGILHVDLMDLKKNDLADPRTNIIFGLKYFQELMRMYYDPTLAIWAYNMGPGNLNKLIMAEVEDTISKIGDPLKKRAAELEYNKMLSDIKRPGTSHLAEKYKLNFSNMMTSAAVQREMDKFEDFNKDEALRYVPRVASAARIFQVKQP